MKNMTKKIAIGLCSMALMGSLASCAATGEAPPAPVAQAAHAEAKEAPSKNTTSSAKRDEASRVTQPVVAKNIAWTVKTDPALKFRFDSLEDMATSKITDAIISGVVTKTTDIMTNTGWATRVLEVQVSNAYKKDVGAVTTIEEEGGVIPLAELLPFLQDRMTKEEIAAVGPNDYVDLTFMQLPHTEVGDEIVFLVRTNPNLDNPNIKATRRVGQYQILNPLGQFVKKPGETRYTSLGYQEFKQDGFDQTISGADLAKRITKTGVQVSR